MSLSENSAFCVLCLQQQPTVALDCKAESIS